MFQIVVKFIVPDHPHLNCLKVGEKHALPKFWWKVKMDFIIIMRCVSYAVVQGGESAVCWLWILQGNLYCAKWGCHRAQVPSLPRKHADGRPREHRRLVLMKTRRATITIVSLCEMGMCVQASVCVHAVIVCVYFYVCGVHSLRALIRMFVYACMHSACMCALMFVCVKLLWHQTSIIIIIFVFVFERVWVTACSFW